VQRIGFHFLRGRFPRRPLPGKGTTFRAVLRAFEREAGFGVAGRKTLQPVLIVRDRASQDLASPSSPPSP